MNSSESIDDSNHTAEKEEAQGAHPSGLIAISIYLEVDAMIYIPHIE